MWLYLRPHPWELEFLAQIFFYENTQIFLHWVVALKFVSYFRLIFLLSSRQKNKKYTIFIIAMNTINKGINIYVVCSEKYVHIKYILYIFFSRILW